MAELRALEPLGVEALGYDLATSSPETVSELVRAMMDVGLGVLVVRNQWLDPPALERVLPKFAPHFGQPLRYDRWPGQSKGVPGCPSLSTLGNYRAKEANQFGMECEVGERIGEFKPARNSVDEWHTDGSFLMRPKVAIALYAPDLADGLPAEGGETRFASCTRAWEALSKEEQKRIAGLASVHSWEAFMRFLEARDPQRPKVTPADCAAKPDVVWPLVRTHPTTGRQSLYVNPKNTRRVLSLSTGAEASDLAGQAGLDFVKALGQRVIDSGVYAHSWKKGDFVIWDNRVLLHAATPFDAERYERLLFRMEFPGEPVVFRPNEALQRSVWGGRAGEVEEEDPEGCFAPPCTPWDFHLPCNPATVCWGYLDAAVPPRLTVRSGEVVRVDNLNGSPEVLPDESEGPWRLLEDYRRVHREVRDRLGPHILTGPIAVEGAEEGDVLQVDIMEVRLRSDWAWTVHRPYGGALGLAAGQHLRHTRLEPQPRSRRTSAHEEGWARPSWGGRLPLRPFFGVLGVAPPPSLGRQHSIPPRDEFGGNLDLKELTAGSTLYLPVHARGALLFVGDGHARQGDGECCGTALETALSGVFKLILHKRDVAEGPLRASEPVERPLRHPRAETARDLITMACHSCFEEAAKLAITDMLDWLESRAPKLARTDAYCFLSVAADVRVTQLVNVPQRGAHVVLRKCHLEEFA